MNHRKYKKYETITLNDRTWPDKELVSAPSWCSVDLRDGNQALAIPMGIEEKIEFYQVLQKMGFKEIEIGFPSASQTEFDFLRRLVKENLILDDVKIQILTQARRPLIERSFEALAGVKKSIVHLYNSTSTLQREVVFNKSKEEIIEIAVEGVKIVKELALIKEKKGESVDLEYSPESFTGTELDFALDICNEVIKVWDANENRKVIINLPATVEMSTPNKYADQIEYFIRHVEQRENVIISLHAHNDRGTGVAATELGLLAGAQRVEGTLFGNGERTGNTDILTVAFNLYSQGIDPKLNIYDANEIKDIYEKVTKMAVHPRHPYIGELVYTAFSGSHQDAINKGINALKEKNSEIWEVPYLPIDPSDLNREYEAIIRINSQSGKGGLAFIMDKEYGYKLPKKMHPDFGKLVQEVTDKNGSELKKEDILKIFKDNYLNVFTRLNLKNYTISEQEEITSITADITLDGVERQVTGAGNGPLSAYINSLKSLNIGTFSINTYREHALGEGSEAQAISYISIICENQEIYGVGQSPNITTSSLYGINSAINKCIGNIK